MCRWRAVVVGSRTTIPIHRGSGTASPTPYAEGMSADSSPTPARAGRPKASSRETLAEAAVELFLERGYEATSIADIARRAGVSRSSFFNYFPAKGDVLWGALDERLDAAIAALSTADVRTTADILSEIADAFAPDNLALAIAHAAAMGIVAELERERAARQLALAGAVSDRARRRGVAPLSADVVGAAYAGAVFSAVWRWADDEPGRTALADLLTLALQSAARVDT